MPSVRWVLVVAVALAALASAVQGQVAATPCAPLAGDVGAPFGANDNHVGVIDLYFFLAQGATVTYYECVGDRAVQLGQRSAAGDTTALYAATTWRCTRRTRRFAATVTLPDGSTQRGLTDIRTPSCASRFRLYAPAHAAVGRRTAVQFRDRWGLGGAGTRWCLTPPAGRPTCHRVRFVVAERIAQRAFVPRTRGLWRVSLHAGRHATSATVAVGVRGVRVPRLPRVLATGDSTMQGVDVALADELVGVASVISDVHPGAALGFAEGWQPVAARQAASRHAAVVVLSIGAAEGFPLAGPDGTEHACCDDAWGEEYSRRMRRVLQTYRRHSRVIVLTVVAPRSDQRAAIVTAVNAATVRAASGLHGVDVLRMDRLFTPAGYRETIRYRGRDVPVREPDGVHLNVVGTTIEARATAPTVRALLARRSTPTRR
jgi:hypothetical protein